MEILYLIPRAHLASFVTPEVNGCTYCMRQPIWHLCSAVSRNYRRFRYTESCGVVIAVQVETEQNISTRFCH